MQRYKVLSKQIYKLGVFSLVPIRFQDRFDIMNWRNEQMYHLRQNKPLTLENQENYFNTVILKLFNQKKPNQILFSFLENDLCIGYGGLVHINWVDKNAEISFVMNTERERKSFEFNWLNFLKLIEKIAFIDLNFHKIFTYAYDLRPRLYSALISAGFKEDARLTDHCIFEENYYDVLIHSKINIKHTLKFREATEDDCKLFFDWVNDKEVRNNAINRDLISWKNHQEWYNKRISDYNTKMYLFFIKDEPVGQIRLENKDGTWLIDYSIKKENRGQGLGTEIVDLIIKKYNQKNYKAIVKSKNIASIKVFEKLGFNKDCSMVSETDLITFSLILN